MAKELLDLSTAATDARARFRVIDDVFRLLQLTSLGMHVFQTGVSRNAAVQVDMPVAEAAEPTASTSKAQNVTDSSDKHKDPKVFVAQPTVGWIAGVPIAIHMTKSKTENSGAGMFVVSLF